MKRLIAQTIWLRQIGYISQEEYQKRMKKLGQ
jgi:hypothetical protein